MSEPCCNSRSKVLVQKIFLSAFVCAKRMGTKNAEDNDGGPSIILLGIGTGGVFMKGQSEDR